MQPDRTRLWIVSGRLLSVGFLAGGTAGALLIVEVWIIFFVMLPPVLLGSWLLDPAKSYWGAWSEGDHDGSGEEAALEAC